MAHRMQTSSAGTRSQQWHQPLVDAIGWGVENGSCHQVYLLTPLLLFQEKDRSSSTVLIGYSNLGYSGRAGYSDLNPRDGG